MFPPTPTTSTPSGPSPTGTPSAGDAAREKAAARAIEAIAGWLGLPQTEFSIGLVEVVAWPDACLGVTRPDLACAQVVTPGERVTVRHRSGVSYEVHLGPREAAAWAAPFESTRAIASVDLAGGVVTLQAIAGNDELGTRHRVVPGSAVAVLKDLKPGDRVRLAVAYPTTPGGMPVIVWLVRAQ
ncbi:MAG: hypothetical protein EPO65_08030 [Dehalococcoidia bacterium]|nr:MAG: hypothetical protein EPO65_08030 [Dehalococcoidia bacterium]